MKNLKKISALIIALIMVLALGVTVMAEADLSGDGVVGDFTTPDTPAVQDNTVKIYKEIKAYNLESTEVNAPEITFNYTIAAGEAGKDIYDVKTAHDPQTNVHVQTKAGVGTPTITGTGAGVLALTTANKFDASSTGASNKYPLTVNFSSVNFTSAGVYRYVITETTTEAVKNASGITEGTGANVLYMDVYVKDNVKENSDDPDFVIYGYTLFTTQNDAIDARDGATTNTVADAGKVEGFVDTTAGTADQYYTFDLTVKKVVVNDKATSEAHHEFPFTITFENETVSAKVLPIMTVSDNATQTALSAASLTSGSWTPTIAYGATVTYVGIPCGTTFTINEKNDVVGTTYASVSTGADTNAESKNIYYNDISNNAVVNCTTALQAATENHTGNSKTVVFTNTLELISPTGVIVRVAPFALILLAGVVLFVIVRRRKVED